MEFTWNPWTGCHKCSEGCSLCFVVEDDRFDRNTVKLSRTGFRLPVQKKRIKGAEKYELEYKIPSGSTIDVCTTSDFFIEEADAFRIEAWEFIHERQDCLFHIMTKRPERIKQCLPDNWLLGWNNVIINVSVETEDRAWQRIPVLLNLPIKHMRIMVAPILDYVDLRPFLSSGLIEVVSVGGESYVGYKAVARECKLAWVRDIAEQCKEYDTGFIFNNTGSKLTLDNGYSIYVPKKDQYGLADFYKLDNISDDIDNWKETAKEYELRSLAEQAHKIYKKLEEENENAAWWKL